MRFVRPHTRSTVALAFLAAAAIFAPPARAQTIGQGSGLRLGVSLGGISTVALSVEFFEGRRGLDVTVGTWSFRDVSMAVTARQYVGGGAVKAFVGGGLWVVLAHPPEGRTGVAVVAQAPVGLDLRLEGDYALGGFVNLNRGLWVRRTDPEDDLPLNKRLVPLPGLYYRVSH